VQIPVKKKREVKSTIIIPPAVKAKLISAPKPDKRKQPPTAAQGSASKGPTGFYWTELDIPFECPAVDCNHVVPSDVPPTLIAFFRQWSKAIYDYGHTAPEVANLATRICCEIIGIRMLDRARRFAKEKGHAVDLVALPERILRWEKDILLLVSDERHRDSCYVWENLLDELKAGKSDLEALEKGKSVPSGVIEHSRPG
jgi:hypothetical protein